MPSRDHGSTVRSLEKAVNAAFLRAGVKPLDTAGQLVYTELAWQNPPLLNTVEKLNGVYLFEYFDHNLRVNPEKLYMFWKTQLQLLYHNAHNAVDKEKDTLANVRKLGILETGQQRLRFSVPEGYPDRIDMFAGALFSLEVAHLAATSTSLEFVRDENNYYVTMADGRIMGVKGGLPAISDPWDVSIAGAVWEFLEMPRGRTSTLCLYDPLAKLRSVLWDRKDDFRGEFQAVDYALQALRRLTPLGRVPRILSSAATLPPATASRAHLGKALHRCLATLQREDATDRQKLSMLYAELVPNILSEAQFRYKIYNLDKPVPFNLKRSVYDRISSALTTELEKLPPKDRNP